MILTEDKIPNNDKQALYTDINNKNLNTNFLDKKEISNKILISPVGEINGKLVEFNTSYIIYEGFKYNITNRLIDIKKEYRNGKKYKIYSCHSRRKDEHLNERNG